MPLHTKTSLAALSRVAWGILLAVVGVQGQDKPRVVPAELAKPEIRVPEQKHLKPTIESAAAAKAAVADLKQASSAEIKGQLDAFKNAREAYLVKQRELSEKLRGASTERRRDVQVQLEVLRKEWFDRSRSFREEAQRRVPDLKDFPRYEPLGRRPPLTDSK